MNEVSIIINGVRYDAVEMNVIRPNICRVCELSEWCFRYNDADSICDIFELSNVVFKKVLKDETKDLPKQIEYYDDIE